ncbi:MAG: hypothetical protein QNI98_10715 [Woeseiaceae bacterium]|nr:hypothetical protein [Woeseiaceae bacterium]
MIRLIGILTGAAIAIGLLIVTLGIPEFSQSKLEPVEDDTLQLEAAPNPATESMSALDIPPAPEPSATSAPAPEPEPVESGIAATMTDEELVEQIFTPQPEPVLDEHWYAFWSPFRSEIAANGFVSRLQQTTGMDYRVVKLKPGVYEVAFAYSDQDDIEQKLARISAATGLDMSGG